MTHILVILKKNSLNYATFLIEIELHHFPLPLPPSSPSHIPPLSLIIIAPYIHVLMHMYVCVYTNIKKHNLLSPHLLLICIWFQS